MIKNNLHSILQSLAKRYMIFLIEFLKGTVVQCLTDLFSQFVIEIEIMRNGKVHTDRFLRLDQMTNVGAAIIAAGRATAIAVKGTGILRVLLIAQIDLTVPGKEVTVTGIAAGHNAIEEIHAAVDSFNNITGRSDPHQIAWLLLRHMRLDYVDDVVHNLGLLTDGKTADGVTVQV